MRKLVCDHLLSLDGYHGGPDDEIDWFTFDEESLEWSRQLLRSADTVLMGRRTHDLMAQYWPTEAAQKEEPVISERLTELPKIVFSRTLDSHPWKNTHYNRRPIAEVVREEKRKNGKNLLVIGSSTILAALWKEHLVDELHVRIQPIVLGKGRPLFPVGEPRQPLALKECRMFPSGVAALRYQVLPVPGPT